MAASRRPPPPQPRPDSRPGHIEVVKAIYSYQAQCSDELSFEEGDTLYIVDNSNNWYMARVGNKSGLVPSNYIEAGNTKQVENPAHEAAKQGNVEFLKELIANQVSVNGLDKSESTPLYSAAYGGYDECVTILLSQPGVEINSQNKIGDTALHAGAWKGHPEVVEMLLAKGALTNLKNEEGQVPLDLSIRNPETARLLSTH